MEEETENQQTPPFTIKLTSRFHNLSDQKNQYCLNNGDTLVLSLVTGLLTIENYGTWARAAFRAKNKLGFVDGSITKPLDPNDPSWKLGKDAMI